MKMAVVDFKRDERISPQHRKVLREFCSELGGDPVRLANALGVLVFDGYIDDGVSALLKHDPHYGSDSGYIIVVDRRESLARQKFSIAHELGHFVLHRETAALRAQEQTGGNVVPFHLGGTYRAPDKSYYDSKTSKLSGRMEREADLFASTVLLPLHLLKATDEFKSGEPSALAARTDLSVAFVVRRFGEALDT